MKPLIRRHVAILCWWISHWVQISKSQQHLLVQQVLFASPPNLPLIHTLLSPGVLLCIPHFVMASRESVLITGCSDGGLGAALASTFHERGYRVFATSRSLKTMSKVSGLSGIRVLQLDITNATDIEAAKIVLSEETGGSLSYLINCAARNHFMPLLDENIEDAKAIHDTNVWGPLAVTQAFAPMLIKAKGAVVFITSIAGHLNTPYQGTEGAQDNNHGENAYLISGTYAASKMSEEIMAETLRLELAPFGVNVLSVVSGALKTMGQTHFDDWKLPANSLYAPLEETIRDRARGQEGAPRMAPEEYAKRVVSEITAGRAGKFWYGASAGIVKFAVSCLPTWMMVIKSNFLL